MNVHIALFRWKSSVGQDKIKHVLKEIEALVDKIPGIEEISSGTNTSKYGAGYTHVVLVRGKNQEAIDAYRNHPDHQKAAAQINAMTEHGIGVDFKSSLAGVAADEEQPGYHQADAQINTGNSDSRAR